MLPSSPVQSGSTVLPWNDEVITVRLSKNTWQAGCLVLSSDLGTLYLIHLPLAVESLQTSCITLQAALSLVVLDSSLMQVEPAGGLHSGNVFTGSSHTLESLVLLLFAFLLI